MGGIASFQCFYTLPIINRYLDKIIYNYMKQKYRNLWTRLIFSTAELSYSITTCIFQSFFSKSNGDKWDDIDKIKWIDNKLDSTSQLNEDLKNYFNGKNSGLFSLGTLQPPQIFNVLYKWEIFYDNFLQLLESIFGQYKFWVPLTRINLKIMCNKCNFNKYFHFEYFNTSLSRSAKCLKCHVHDALMIFANYLHNFLMISSCLVYTNLRSIALVIFSRVFDFIMWITSLPPFSFIIADYTIDNLNIEENDLAEDAFRGLGYIPVHPQDLVNLVIPIPGLRRLCWRG